MTFGNNTPWGAATNKAIENDLKAEGIEWKAVLPDPNDPALQARHMDQAISLKPDIILLAPADANAIVPKLQRAKASGVPVMIFNSPVAEGAENLVVTTLLSDNEAMGTFAGENLVAGLKEAGYDKANIVNIHGTSTMEIVQIRNRAFDKVLSAHPEYKVVEEEDSNWDPGKTAQIMTQLIAKHRAKGGIQGAFGTADYMAMGIVSAAKQAGVKVGVKDKGLVVVASNCSEEGARGMVDGELAGNATSVPQEMSDLVKENMVKYFNGEKLPPTVQGGVTKITPENAKEFVDTCTY